MEAYNALYPQTSWMHPAPDVQQSQDAAQAAVQGDSMSAHPSTIDINHPSFGLAEIQQASSSNSSTIAPAALFHTFAPLAQNGHAGFYSPYNVMAYGQTPWNQQQHLPLSSYSTLNGATTSASQPQQRQDSPPIQPMLIDPSLTINPTASSSRSQSYTHNGDQQSQQSTYHSMFSQSPSIPQQTLSINPMFVNALSHQQLQQQQQQQQTTLSPTVLHTPPTSVTPSSFYPTSAAPVQTNLTASSSNAGSSSASAETLTQRRNRLQSKLKTLSSHSGAGAVKAMVNAIDDCGASDVDAPMRLEIITRIRDKSPAHFFRAWCENADAMDITREWLKEGATGRDDGVFEETIMPLLQVIARLPFNLEQLKQYKLGKIIVKLTKEAPNPAIKDMAADIEKGWKQLIAESQDAPPKKEGNNEDRNKKRKLLESTSKSAPPTKKIASSSTSSSSKLGGTVKRETKVVTSVVKEAKSDSSFFSQSKAKAKLPSFKKAQVPPPPSSSSAAGTSVKRENEDGSAATANIAHSSPIDPFQEALKAMQRSRRESPAAIAQMNYESTAATTPAVVKSEFTKSGKKRKTVTWAPDGKLEQIKLIEKAIYDDDPMDGSHSSHSIRELERAEGAAMHAHLFEESIDWYEPIVLQLPDDIQQLLPRGTNSQERDVQEEREKSSLEVLYVNVHQVPDTPAEPSNQIPIEQVDVEAKTMLAGSEIQPFFASAMNVSQLVGQLKGPEGVGQVADQQNGFPNTMNTGSFNNPDVQMMMQSLMASTSANNNNNNAGAPSSAGNAQFDLSQLGFDANTLSSLTASLLGNGTTTAATNTTNGTNPNPFGNMFPENGVAGTSNGYPGGFGDEYGSNFGDRQRGDREREDHSGRGRRGKGRGAVGMDGYRNKRKAAPCIYFQQGRCKYGDTCDFSHDAHRDAGGGSAGYFD